MYGYIYITTNLINNKKYIGKKVSSKFLETKYLGSGTLIKKAIEKYGRDNFSIILLEECNSNDELNEREIYWISYYNSVESNEYYNLAIGGEGSVKGSKKSDHCKKAISESAKHRVLDSETRSKISKTVSSQIWVTNDIIETKATYDNISDFINKGFHRGRLKFTEDHIRNMSNANTGRKLSDKYREALSNNMKGSKNPFYNKTHSNSSKSKMRESQSDRHYINNGEINKRVKSSELELYINNCWVRGMIKAQRLSKV